MNVYLTSEQSRLAEGLQIIRNQKPNDPDKKFRVAAYCRVSTNMKLQESSLETQMASFRQRISENPGWELVGIYADKGVSGTSAKGRIAFQRLMNDAAAGKIDYIMAKSISRFARNTVDALSYTRQLKDLGVGVYFEEQALDTLSASSEVFLTIHAAFAQEESHSFSENMKRGIRNRFALGTPKWTGVYGYRCNGDDVWYICEEEAAVVREIFRMYTEGYTINDICDELNAHEIKPPMDVRKEGGKPTWWLRTVGEILRNEKYIGDAEMQKTYTVDCLTHRRVSNRNAEVTKYYKSDHHVPIIDRETFKLARTIASLRDRHEGCSQYPFYGYLKCPFCGENMARLLLPTKGREVAWFCEDKCKLCVIKEKYLHKAVMEAGNKVGRTSSAKQVEYKFLYDHVEKITFEKTGDRVNWKQLVVHWKDGEQTMVEIAYETPSDIPCTKLECVDGMYRINDEPINRRQHTAACVERIWNYVSITEVDKSDAIPAVTRAKENGVKRA